MKKPLVDEILCEGWDDKHYEPVCVLIDIDQVGISDDDIMDDIIPAFFEGGMIVIGDTCSVIRINDTIVIGKFTWVYRTGKHSKVH